MTEPTDVSDDSIDSTLGNPGLRQHLQDWISSQGEDAFSWVECHGLIAAMALLTEQPPGWQQTIAVDIGVPDSIAQALEQLRQRLAADLGAGEKPLLPCRLDPYLEDEGNDLTAWCIGFMSGIYLDDALWQGSDEQVMADRLLPMVLIAGLEEDEELDLLWQDSSLTRQIAHAIPELLQELFLYFQAPELLEEEDSEDSSESEDTPSDAD